MGFDKAAVVIGGEPLARRVAAAVAAVADPVVEVGPGLTGLPQRTREVPAGSGPLSAIAAGASALDRLGYRGPVVVVACDLPRLDQRLLAWLADHPTAGSVVPVVAGRAQPLCARWSSRALRSAPSLLAQGDRSLRGLLDGPDVCFVDERSWASVADAATFADADVPADLDATGLPWHPPSADARVAVEPDGDRLGRLGYLPR
jgi:molybdopterin-guanine dinucleotide biosynthesis protein A